MDEHSVPAFLQRLAYECGQSLAWGGPLRDGPAKVSEDAVVQDTPGLVRGADGLMRCWWADAGAPMLHYHDSEWGQGSRSERALFERLSLEALQAGLSWRIVLERRDALRTAFAHFEPATLADMPHDAVDRLLREPGMIRHRGKIAAILANATLLQQFHASGSGLAALTEEVLASAANTSSSPPVSRADVPAHTPTSAALAQRLRRVGWRFIGPTSAYAYLQAVGFVNDHLVGCHARAATAAASTRVGSG